MVVDGNSYQYHDGGRLRDDCQESGPGVDSDDCAVGPGSLADLALDASHPLLPVPTRVATILGAGWW